jgi:hypothetical protein
MLSLSALIGCAKGITIYPITDQDFAFIEKGKPSTITGIAMSEFYYNEVLGVKLENK